MKWTIGTGAAAAGSAKRLFVILAGCGFARCRQASAGMTPGPLETGQPFYPPVGRTADWPGDAPSGRKAC
jgi:hypothetical protein